MNIAAITRFKNGELLRLLRKLQWTGAELSRRSGVPVKTISGLLCLKRRPSKEVSFKIQKAFGEVGEFLDLEKAWPKEFVGIDRPPVLEQYQEIEAARLSANNATGLIEYRETEDILKRFLFTLSPRQRDTIESISKGQTLKRIAKRWKVTGTIIGLERDRVKRMLTAFLADNDVFDAAKIIPCSDLLEAVSKSGALKRLDKICGEQRRLNNGGYSWDNQRKIEELEREATVLRLEIVQNTKSKKNAK